MTVATYVLIGAVLVLAAAIVFLGLIHGEVILQPRDLTDDQIHDQIAPVASGIDVTPIRLVDDPARRGNAPA